MKREPLIVQVPTLMMQVHLAKLGELTLPQKKLLVDAHDCTPPSDHAVRHGWVGIAVHGARVGIARRLEKLGYLDFMGNGRSEDDEAKEDREYPIYAITEKGRRLVTLASPSSRDDKEGGGSQ